MESNPQTSELRGHRTLATVVFTDCVGFSAKMSRDEDHTLDLIRRDLKLMQRVCEQYEGRVLKSTGDGLLMYFISAIRAVKCAVEIQDALTNAAIQLSERDVLKHRIGVHLADMFITDTDVMGNGVNIAARLQAEADPGGICISQTVYDVVKTGLQLHIKYLGPRKLKNIDEVVPAYKILLQPELEESDPCESIVQNLQANKNHLRIRKLIYYACKNVWESDTHLLNLLDLKELIQELVKLAPTLPRLQSFLGAAVKTLSKPAEYQAIAQIVVTELEPLYPSEAGGLPDSAPTQVTAHRAHPQVSDPELQQRYDQIAESLASLSSLPRIKKLCYYVCRKKWESDPEQLQGVPMAALIAEIHQASPDLEQFRLTLDSFVKTLSKSAEYVLVANTLIQHLQPLYLSPASAHPENLQSPKLAAYDRQASSAAAPPYAETGVALEQEQNLLRIKKLMFYLCERRWENNAAALNNLNTESLVRQLHQMAPAAAQLEAALEAVVKSLSKPAEYQAIAHTILRRMASLYPGYQPPKVELDSTNMAVSETADGPAPASHETSRFSLFDARLDIMRNTNPLSAKILLFTALKNEFHFTEQDWLALKLTDLDGLLREALNCCQSYTDMEELLYRAARTLPTPDEYVHTATRLIKSLRFFYLHGKVPVTLPPMVEDTDIPLAEKAGTSGTEESITILEQADMTCQLAEQTILPAVEVLPEADAPAEITESWAIAPPPPHPHPSSESDPTSDGTE